MTTASRRPIPPHGSYARANGSPGYREPCRCQPCLTTKRHITKRSRVNRQLGRPGIVDAAPARRHLQTLHQTMSWGDLKKATGCAVDTLVWIIEGRRTEIYRTTANRILAVQPGPTSDGNSIDATGTRRRLRALQVTGYTLRHIADELGGSAERIRIIVNGSPRVRKSMADKIAAAYRRLATVPGPSGIARRRALAHGWHGPLAWDGNSIDDPAALPDTDDVAELSLPERRAADAAAAAEEIQHLAGLGESVEEIARRVGRSVGYVRDQINGHRKPGWRAAQRATDLDGEAA